MRNILARPLAIFFALLMAIITVGLVRPAIASAGNPPHTNVAGCRFDGAGTRVESHRYYTGNVNSGTTYDIAAHGYNGGSQCLDYYISCPTGRSMTLDFHAYGVNSYNGYTYNQYGPATVSGNFRWGTRSWQETPYHSDDPEFLDYTGNGWYTCYWEFWVYEAPS